MPEWARHTSARRGRYLLRVTVGGKGMTPDSKREFPIWIRNYEKLHEASTPIKVSHRWRVGR
jgi:hypothetical protein